ncbi:MAG TPA: alpha/beta fold hydrolase [Polyangiaceae bacterium]|jgi:polyhydroxyalkanoate synthase
MADVAPTPRDTLWRDGSASLYRFRRPASVRPAAAGPVLVVPSMINRWYVVDLRAGASLVEALVAGGLDVFCLDWGAAQDEDRFLSWDDVLERLGRAVRFVERTAKSGSVGLLGYCMGATLAGIYTALEPKHVSALINLAGPFDFAHGGLLRTMVDPQWFDAQAVAEAGNVAPMQMQSGFVALRPTSQLAKWVSLLDRAHDEKSRVSFDALETWAGDNIAFPAAAYATYIEDLYQKNALVRGEHHVRGRRVDLGAICCPVLTVAAERDTICPLPAARALNEACGSADKELIVVPGGHVGAVVGSRAPKVLYPAMRAWLGRRLATEEAREACN